MPLYEYKCRPCSRDFELLRPMEVSNKTAECPSCGKPSSRILSVFASSVRGGASSGERKSADSGPASSPSGGGCCGGGACGPVN
ncbi:MAG: zinc ribbon domain-containing protein [Dehalococcoidia bacterium]|nr:zinc ribbon domain-containing protein [Dehalococcoidia bacterium]MSQ35405.1 zinc ribbon domain-containing protein [Dehalococcoidia bacterium]